MEVRALDETGVLKFTKGVVVGVGNDGGVLVVGVPVVAGTMEDGIDSEVTSMGTMALLARVTCALPEVPRVVLPEKGCAE